MCHPVVIFIPLPDTLHSILDATTHDFNFSGKIIGFLAHEVTDFTFIAPDRQQHNYNNLKEYIRMAFIIRAIGVPNYKCATFPVHSHLNIDV